jgi:small conductance mechanosensitive channel
VPAAFGQFPFLPTVESSQNEEPVFDFFNRPYQCGNLRCSNVWFNGQILLKVASLPSSLTENGNANISVEQRARKIEINLQQILKATLQSSGETSEKSEGEPTIVPDPLELIKNSSTAEKGELDPATPPLEVGTLNNQTVIFVPKQPGIPRQTLLTVTEPDAIANFKSTPEELAVAWRDRLRQAFSNAIKERQQISKNPLQRPLIILAIAAVLIILSLALLWLQKRLSNKDRNLKKQLNDFKKSLAAETESVASETAIKSKPKSATNSSKKGKSSKSLLLALSQTNLAFVSQITGLLEKIPDISLKKQTDLKQQQNSTEMLQLVLLWFQVLLWVGGVGLILAIYPYTRAFTIFIWTQSPFLLLIWLSASLADKGSNFLVDFWLQRWAEKARETSSYPQRYTKRVTTYSEALTQATTFIVYAVAIALTIPALGFSLAGAGILGIAATYVFKPKVDNVINGVVILWSDRYAVGDVIQIGDRAGLVENLNLYMTELRGDGGRLISIPNGSIDIVENLTKEWSRVEVAIELAYSTDVERALEILKTVAEQMQQEPEWDEKILEPASIFGLDSMTYDGLLVQIWVKTAPMQQWSVARELRVRVKQAFDREGIALGMPQRSLFLRQEAILGKREEGEK